jgi:EAL domain-containing protein (putative c-di-GMP-specific phosphodiesterase class I)
VLQTGQVEGVEALVRWQHPERGLVPPGDFIPIAEDTGLIVPLGQWVLHEATRHGRELHERFPMEPPLTMSVNLSARQLQRPEIVREVQEALEISRFDPGSLILEITETVMMDDMDMAIARMHELKALGIKLAVDDFGSGYSSLNYIRHFPIDVLKVDKSFIDVVSDHSDQAQVTAKIIELAGILQLCPVAEGIERPEQLEELLNLRCELGQGYLFARPLTPVGIEEFVEDLQRSSAAAVKAPLGS